MPVRLRHRGIPQVASRLSRRFGFYLFASSIIGFFDAFETGFYVRLDPSVATVLQMGLPRTGILLERSSKTPKQSQAFVSSIILQRAWLAAGTQTEVMSSEVKGRSA